MKYFKILFISVAMVASIEKTCAQKTAVTDTGEIVILYDDGTWNYENEEEIIDSPIPSNPTKFKKNSEAKFLIKSKINDSGFYIDTKKWQHNAGTNNADAEYEFQLKGGDLYALAITERISIPLSVLKTAVLTNARAASPGVKIIHEEFRIVNDQTILQLEMQGNIDGIDFTYYGYFMSTSKGSTQWLVYTSTALINEYRSEIDNLLNGLVQQ
jgi:hypothetical protein